MAEIVKYPAYAIGRLILHSNRREDDGVIHENRNIDNERTHLNYYLKEGGVEDIKRRLEEVPHLNKKNIVSLCEFMIAKPPDVKKEDERRFFESVYSFMKNDFGEENIMDVVIHKDEITPHMHGYFIPVFKDKSGNERLCAKELINRTYLRSMHTRLAKYTEKDLGYPVSILTGATAGGNRTILELKNDTLKKEIESQQRKLESLNSSLNFLKMQIEKTGFDTRYFSSAELFATIEHLNKENTVLKKIVSEHHLPIDKSIIKESLNLKKIMTDGHFRTITDEDYGADDIIVIETYKKQMRIPPLRKKIEQDEDLVDIINSEPQELTRFKNYLIFPTDNIRDTVENLVKMKENENEYQNIYFTSITNDKFNLSETLLRQCTFNTTYQYRSQNADIQKEYNRTLVL